jgi:hypothetical protein
MTPHGRFVSLALTLPPAPKPVGVYKPCLVVGPHLSVSGHGPLLPDGTLMRGRVGRDLDADGGKQAARQVGLTMLSTLIATLGGPAFIKGVRGPCGSAAGSSSCGVTLDEANLKAWFAAGVFCVGMGSHLIDAEMLKAGRFAELTERTRRLMTILAEI